MFGICWIIVSVGVCLSFKFRCPEVSHWKYSASETCISLDKYVCLENALTKTYQEGCSGIDLSRIGSKLVFQPHFNKKACRNNRYQPFLFSTYKNTDCVLQKSNCEEEGQVIFTSNNTDKDTTCRCDYTKGYTFLFRPRHKCYCIPSEEDCTCFRPTCTFINQDYSCFNHNSTDNQTFECPQLFHEDVETNTSVIDMLEFESQPTIMHSIIPAITSLITLVLLLVLLLIIAAFFPNFGTGKFTLVNTDVSSQSHGSDLHKYDQGAKIADKTTRDFTTRIDSTTSRPEVEVDVHMLDESMSRDNTRHHLVRAVLIGEKGVGKQSLIQRLLFQKTRQNSNAIKKTSWKIEIKDGKWISNKGEEGTIPSNIQDIVMKSEIDEADQDLKSPTRSIELTEEIENQPSDDKSIKEAASDILDVHQESTNQSQSSKKEFSYGSDYHRYVVSLHPEHEDTSVVQGLGDQDETISTSNTMLKYATNSENSSTGFVKNESELNEDYRICELWKVEKQLDFHLVHQVISPSNVVFVLVIDGTHLEDCGEDMKQWLESISCFQPNENKEAHSPVLIVITKIDRLKATDYKESFMNLLSQFIPKYIRTFVCSVHFISNLELADTNFEKIWDDISIIAEKGGQSKINIPLEWKHVGKILEQMATDGIKILKTNDLKKKAREENIDITDLEFTLCLCHYHTVRQVIYFDELFLKDKIILDPFLIVKAFRCITTDSVNEVMRSSDCWMEFQTAKQLSGYLLSHLLQESSDMDIVENKTHVVEVLKQFDIFVNINLLPEFHMPCVMEEASLNDVYGIFNCQNFYRTPWLCLEFEFLSPALFNHILAWYTKQYKVFELPSEVVKSCHTKYALLRNLGVFSLNQLQKTNLLVFGMKHIIAIQIWNTRVPDSLKGYTFIKRRLISFIHELSKRFHIWTDFSLSYKCPEGDVSQNRVEHQHISGEIYKCIEHNKSHSTKDIISSWCRDDNSLFPTTWNDLFE